MARLLLNKKKKAIFLMMQNLRQCLSRPAVYLAVMFPHPLTIALMCRLNHMPFSFEELRSSLAREQDEPLDHS